MAGMSSEQIRRLFAQEAEIRLGQLDQLLLQLEQTGGDDTLVRSIFREIHTLKGSAAVAGLDEVSGVAHDLEELVDDVRSGRGSITAEVIDALLRGNDRLRAAISKAQTGIASQDTPAAEPNTANGKHASQPAGSPSPADPGTSAPLDVAAPQTKSPATSRHSAGNRAGVIMVPVERLEELTRLVGETASAHLRVGRMLKDRFNLDPATLHRVQRAVAFRQRSPGSRDAYSDGAGRHHHRQAASGLRDLSRAQGKDIRWQAEGADTELDRGVLNQLSDSLLHLVRNAVDHGIETPSEREAVGKPRQATVRIHAMQLGSEVIIAVTDDGRGIDVDSVRQQAARHGIDTDGHDRRRAARIDLSTRPVDHRNSSLTCPGEASDLTSSGPMSRRPMAGSRSTPNSVSAPSSGSSFPSPWPCCAACWSRPAANALRCHFTECCSPRPTIRRSWLRPKGGPWCGSKSQPRSRPEPGRDTRTRRRRGSDRAQWWCSLTPPDATPSRCDRLIGQRDVVIKGTQHAAASPARRRRRQRRAGRLDVVVLDPPGLIQRARLASRGTRSEGADPRPPRSAGAASWSSTTR